MRFFTAFLILAGVARGQSTDKIITFSRTDTEHCRVIVVSGKPLLQSTYDGTTVAVAMPLNRGDGDFSVFVSVSRAGSGTIHVNPKDFYGLYSDKDHTRFQFFDKAAEAISEVHAQGEGSAMSANNAQINPASMRPGAVEGRGPPPGNGAANDGPPLGGHNTADTYFRKGKVKPGSGIAGWITLRQPSGGKLEVHPTDMLDEVDIPVNGVLFRF